MGKYVVTSLSGTAKLFNRLISGLFNAGTANVGKNGAELDSGGELANPFKSRIQEESEIKLVIVDAAAVTAFCIPGSAIGALIS